MPAASSVARIPVQCRCQLKKEQTVFVQLLRDRV